MEKSFRWKELGKLYVYFFFFSGLYQALIYFADMSNTTGLRQAIFMSTLWLIPVFIWPHHTRKISAIIGIVLWFSSLANLSYFYIFGQDFSQSVIFIIFESNFSESSEFIESYLTPTIIGILILYATVSISLWKRLKPVYLTTPHKIVAVSTIAFIFSWAFVNPLFIKGKSWDVSVKHLQDRIEPAAPWHLVAGYFKYTKVLQAMQQQLAENSQIAPLKGLVNSNQNKNSTMVLVIGESTNRQRMSLYGYNRQTTPNLNNLRNEIFSFNNVISPRPYTIEALQQALTFADQQNPDLYLTQPTLINMMKQAGYTSYWITNQQTQTKRNTMLLTFSQQTDQQVYLNNNRVQNSAQFDAAVLAPFEKALSDSGDNKFIVVHLIGTHRKYNYRFPDNFKHFVGRDGVPDWVPDSNIEVYNDYDNAILYNDYIVSSLINILKEKATNSTLVYFSDHGEEVYDSSQKLFTGRNEGAPTTAMYTVPFITWLSPLWKSQINTQRFNEYLDRPYMLSDFIYSWADLAAIKFSQFEPTRSLFNEDFVVQNRLIGSPDSPKTLVNFDTLFKQNIIPDKYLVQNNHTAINP